MTSITGNVQTSKSSSQLSTTRKRPQQRTTQPGCNGLYPLIANLQCEDIEHTEEFCVESNQNVQYLSATNLTVNYSRNDNNNNNSPLNAFKWLRTRRRHTLSTAKRDSVNAYNLHVNAWHAIRATCLLWLVLPATLVDFDAGFIATTSAAIGRIPIRAENGIDDIPEQMPGCFFDGKFFDLEDKWHPDLGPPFGVMYCVECECVAVPRKGRIVGKVRCRNFKNDCPVLTCKEPVAALNQCCKACPQESTEPLLSLSTLSAVPSSSSGSTAGAAPSIINTAAMVTTTRPYRHAKTSMESEVNGAKEMTALLTGVRSAHVALAKFHFAKPNLYFSVYITGGGSVERIYSVSFREAAPQGALVLEQKTVAQQFVEPDHYCGLWERLPRDQRRMLMREQLKFAVNTSVGVLEGIIVLRTPNFEAQFASLLTLERPPMQSVGAFAGYAAIGMHGRNSPLQVYVEIEISPATMQALQPTANSYTVQAYIVRPDEGITLHQASVEAILLSKTRVVINARLESLSNQEGKWMARKQLQLRLYSPALFGFMTVVGDIVTQPTCSVFQAILYEPERRPSAYPLMPYESSPAAAGGLALLRLRKDGSMQYWVHVEGMENQQQQIQYPSEPANIMTQLTIESEPKRKARRRQVEDITNVYSAGWANGTYEKPKARDIKLLLSDKLYVNAATQINPNALQGSLRQLLFQPVHLTAFPSLILEQHVGDTASSLQPPGAGAVWLRVDEHCVLHYDIYVDGYAKELAEQLTAFLTVAYMNEYGLAESNRFQLERFDELKSTGKVKDIRRDAMRRLLNGTVSLEILFPGEQQPRLRSRARVVNECAREASKNYNFLGIAAEQATSSKSTDGMKYECRYEGQTYREGEGWRSSSDACAMCSCRRGRVQCDAVICPKLDCPNNVTPFGGGLQTSDGDCCPTKCPSVANNNVPMAAALASSSHNDVGGQSASANIVNTETTDVKTSVDDVIRNNNNAITASGDASDGGCFFHRKWRKRGEQWHPYLPTFGFSPCVLCVCEANATIACKRKACPALGCDESDAIRRNSVDCCKSCPDEKERLVLHTSKNEVGGASSSMIGRYQNEQPSSKSAETGLVHHQYGTMSDAAASPTSVSTNNVASENLITPLYNPQDVLNRGGCQFQSFYYENGHEWHPKVLPFGTLKCIRCMCKDGQSHCRRQKCPILTCHYIVKNDDECCPQCARKDNPDARPNRRWRRYRRKLQRVQGTSSLLDRASAFDLDEES